MIRFIELLILKKDEENLKNLILDVINVYENDNEIDNYLQVNYNVKIKPNLFFIHVPLDKSNSVGFYSLIFCYKTALKILNKIDKGITEDEYFTLCANIIFYINSKNNTNNFIDLTNYVPPNNKSKKSINEVKEEKVKIIMPAKMF